MSMPDGYFPKYAVKEAEMYKTNFLKKNSKAASDLHYRFLYNKKGEACLEFSVTPKDGYTWPEPKWIGYIWNNPIGSIGNGKINYTITKKLFDEAQYRMEERRKDPVFFNIEKAVYKIALEYSYDFKAAYGKTVKYRRSNTKKAVCEGYSNAVENAFHNHPLVKEIETWSSAAGNHAWNVIILKDRRKIYCDATWYDGNNIDEDGYVVDIPDREPVDLTFDINEFNNLGGAINISTRKLLAVHFGWSDAKKMKIPH
jgi:hypothetical protein